MSRTTGPLELALTIDRHDREPLRDQVARQIREAIRAGRLAPGAPLPATRALAERLQISRGVIVEAYGDLRQQGFLVVRARSLPRVADGIVVPPPAVRPPDPAPRLDLLPGRPDPSLFPRAHWLRSLRVALASAPDRAFDEGDGRGQEELRIAVAAHLGRTRGVVTSPDCVLVCQGGSQAIELACRLLAAQGIGELAIEDPSAAATSVSAIGAGLCVRYVPVDGDGIVVSALADGAAVVVTPASQYPSGVRLGEPRRRALLQRAGFLVEDDRGAEHGSGAGPSAIQGRAPERVLHVGSVSQTLAPGLRLGWLVVPPALSEQALGLRRALDGGSPSLDQLALADLLGSATLDRHLRRLRVEYGRRRAALVSALGAVLPETSIRPADAGLHLILTLREPALRSAIGERARAERIRVAALEDYLQERPSETAALVVSYARVPAAAAGSAAHALHRVIDPTAPPAQRHGPRRVVTAARGVPGRVKPGGASVDLRILTLDVYRDDMNVAEIVRRTGADVICLQNPQGRIVELAQAIGYEYVEPAQHIVSRLRLVRPASDTYMLVELAPGRFAAVANVHLSSDEYAPLRLLSGVPVEAAAASEREIRIPELQPILETARGLARSGVPVIAAGSFNSPLEPGWPLYEALLGAGLCDVLTSDSGPTWPVPGLGYVAADGEGRIDGMFVGGPATVRTAELVGEPDGSQKGRRVIEPWLGEHRGVLALVRAVPAAVAPFASSTKAIVSATDGVAVVVVGPTEPGSRLLLVPAGTTPRRAVARRSASDAGERGIVVLPATGLRPAAYEVLLADPGGRVLSRSEVWIAARGAAPSLRPSRRRYRPGQAVELAWRDAPGHRWDYVALHLAAADIDRDDPVLAVPTTARPVGVTRLGELEPGQYLAALMLDDGVQVLAVCDFVVLDS